MLFMYIFDVVPARVFEKLAAELKPAFASPQSRRCQHTNIRTNCSAIMWNRKVMDSILG